MVAMRDLGPLVGQMATQAGAKLSDALANVSPQLESDIIILVLPRIVAERDPKGVLVATITVKANDKVTVATMLEGAYERVLSEDPQMSGEIRR